MPENPKIKKLDAIGIALEQKHAVDYRRKIAELYANFFRKEKHRRTSTPKQTIRIWQELFVK